MAAYLGYTQRMKTLFRGWPIMVNDTHTRRRRRLLHFFTPGSKPTFSANPSHLNFSSLLIGLLSWSWDWTRLIMLISLFLVFFLLYFLFVKCGRLSWLSVSFLLNVKYTVSYHIVFPSFKVNQQIHLIMLISVLSNFTSSSIFIGQVSLPHIKRLLTHDVYTLPFSFNENAFPVVLADTLGTFFTTSDLCCHC